MTWRWLVVGVVIVAAGLGIIAPYVLGMLTQVVVDEFVAMSNVTGDAEVEIVEYERGWFHSRMSLGVSFPEDDDTSIVFDHELRHGPLLPASACGARFGFALSTGHSSLRPVTPVIEDFLPDGRMSDDCIFFGFNGDINAVQDVASFAGTDFDADGNPERTPIQVGWAPISVRWTYLNDTRPKLRGSLSAPRLNLNDSTTHVQIDALTMGMDLQRAVLPEVWDGEVTFAMGQLRTWEADTQAPISIEHLELLMQAHTGTEQANFEMSLGYEMLSAGAREFGAGHWSLKFEDLGTRGILALNERRESLLIAGIPQESELYVEAFREFMPEILATDPRLVLDFAQDLDGIPVSVKGYARITKPGVITSTDPRRWLAGLELDLALSAPQWLLRDAIEYWLETNAGDMLAEMERNGFLQQRDEAYRVRLYLRDGNATVNDQYVGNYIDILLNAVP